jgi:hypothetical protein
MIVLAPCWHNQQCFQEADKRAVKTCFYKIGTKMFETMDCDVPGTRWPTMAMLLVGAAPRDVRLPVDHNPKFPGTISSSRRYRRKYKEDPLYCRPWISPLFSTIAWQSSREGSVGGGSSSYLARRLLTDALWQGGS